jgi:hypothetical protein
MKMPWLHPWQGRIVTTLNDSNYNAALPAVT